jgi:TPR repeat protein
MCLLLLALFCIWNVTAAYAQQGDTAEPTQPEDTAEPTQPEDAAEPTQPEDTAEPTQPEDAAEPTQPEDAAEPTQPEDTAEATQPEDPSVYLEKAQQAFDVGDVVGAMALYRKAAELGDAAAQTRLGYLLDQAEQNQEAGVWLEKAAAQGYAEAEYRLARMYAAPGELPLDLDRAAALFERAAKRGYTPAIRVLAGAYETGALELTRDYDTAVAWLREGVEAGDAWSISRLSRAYRNGELGLRIDMDKVRELDDMTTERRAQTE